MDSWSLYRYTSESRARSSAASGQIEWNAVHDTSVADRELRDASERLDRLLLIVDALWSLLQEHGYSDDQLRSRLEAITGSRIGKPGQQPTRSRCASCDWLIEPGAKVCNVCGEEIPYRPADEP